MPWTASTDPLANIRGARCTTDPRCMLARRSMLGLWVRFVSFNDSPLSATSSMFLHFACVEVFPATAAGRLDQHQGSRVWLWLKPQALLFSIVCTMCFHDWPASFGNCWFQIGCKRDRVAIAQLSHETSLQELLAFASRTTLRDIIDKYLFCWCVDGKGT